MIVRRQGGLTEFIPSPQEKRDGVLRDHTLELLANLDARIARHAFYHIVSWCDLQENDEHTMLSIPMGASQQHLSIDNTAF